MQATLGQDCVTDPSGVWPEAGRDLRSRRARARAACVVTTLLFFAADVILPRGATPAIGYCLVLVLARATDRMRFLLGVAGVCTVLTWVGYFIEPAGAAWWMSVFERGMVTGVLWLTLVLVWRRMEAVAALARQAQALREAARELRRSNAELQDFASAVSHDIRGPLNSVTLLLNLIATRPAVKADAECAESIDSILSEITRVTGMMQALLAYARVGAGAVIRSDCDVEAVLGGVRRALRAQLEGAGAAVTNDPLPTVPADPAMLAELLQNLVENGVKYRGPAPPVIHLSATPVPEGWLFAVRDNGVGIRPAECGRVFEPFYRGTAVRASPGAGLGLATCKRIVERHGGRIDVRSAPGQGSTFTFLIPALPPMEGAAAPAAPASAASRPA